MTPPSNPPRWWPKPTGSQARRNPQSPVRQRVAHLGAVRIMGVDWMLRIEKEELVAQPYRGKIRLSWNIKQVAERLILNTDVKKRKEENGN